MQYVYSVLSLRTYVLLHFSTTSIESFSDISAVRTYGMYVCSGLSLTLLYIVRTSLLFHSIGGIDQWVSLYLNTSVLIACLLNLGLDVGSTST